MTASELKAFLKRHTLAPDEFAKLIGVTHMAVLHWLHERRAISLTVGRLCKIFDKHPELMRKFGN